MSITIGSYKVLFTKVIGKGTFGQVYKASHVRTKEDVAVKQIPLSHDDVDAHDSTLHDMAQGEIDALRRLVKHPNIVRLLDHISQDDSIYIFMDYCDLNNVGVYLKSNNNLKFLARLDIMNQTASAVAFMHRQRPPIIHRDLKLQNILLKTENDKAVVKVTDFGLAMLCEDMQWGSLSSFANNKFMTSAVGTQYFQAPELSDSSYSSREYDSSIDVFSLGLACEVIYNFSQDNPSLIPLSVRARNSKAMVAFGCEQRECKNNRRRLPVITEIHPEDDQAVTDLKNLMLQMTEYCPDDRVKIHHVSAKFEEIIDLLKAERSLGAFQIESGCHRRARRDEYIMSVAIEIGDTNSSFGFSFKNNPDEILHNKAWSGFGSESYKTQTAVLTKNNGEFVAFGLEASHRYEEYYNERDDYTEPLLFFRNFAETLGTTRTLSSRTFIEAEDKSGEAPAMLIYQHAMRYMGDKFMDSLASRTGSRPEADIIRWVVTVPTVMSSEIRQFVKEAFVEAECIDTLDSPRLTIVSAIEAASMWCLHKTQFIGSSKYVIVDAGYKTNIAAQEYINKGEIKELHFDGDAWGEERVRDNILNLLQKVLGKDFITKYKRSNPHAMEILMREFLRKTQLCSLEESTAICVEIPWSICKEYSEIMAGKQLQDLFISAEDHGISHSNGNMRLNHKAVVALCEPVAVNIIEHIKSVLTKPDSQPCKAIFFIGDFTSRIILDLIRKAFEPQIQILTPDFAELAVLRGAVLLGHEHWY